MRRFEERPCLTEQEKKIVLFLFEGLSNPEMALALHVTEFVVGATLRQLFERFGVRTRPQLVATFLTHHQDLLWHS
jgi:DNA-binding CsgD family transcriptional regulator